MSKKEMTRYQTRITKLVYAANAYLVLCPIALLYFDVSAIGWIVYFSTGTINYCIAAGCDAVFDSLSERTNIQSSWLHVRLTEIERAVNANSGQEAWNENGVPTNDAEHYFHNYPERLEN